VTTITLADAPSYVRTLALERAVFAYRDGGANPFDSSDVDAETRLHLLTRVRWHKAYEVYLRSHAWRAKRHAVLERADNHCERCDGGGGLFAAALLEVHHWTYDHLGDERLDELEALCRDCHREADGERRNGRVQAPRSGRLIL
jgi:5-methylcytosine-specific restriction endonuclease McrA